MGKLLHQHRQHNLVQIRAAGEDLLAACCQLALGPDRQGEQVEEGIEVGLLAQLLQVDPVHLLEEHLQQPGQLGGAEVDPLVWRDHHHLQVLHLRMLLKEPAALRCQAVLEARIGVHLHLQQHHWELLAAGFGAAGALARPEHAVEAMAQLFELEGFKSVEAVAGC